MIRAPAPPAIPFPLPLGKIPPSFVKTWAIVRCLLRVQGVDEENEGMEDEVDCCVPQT